MEPRLKTFTVLFNADVILHMCTLVGDENRDAVCLWKGDSQEHIFSAMMTIIFIMVALWNRADHIMVALWNRADHYIFILSFVLSIFFLA